MNDSQLIWEAYNEKKKESYYIEKLRDEIKNLDPARDVRESFWDALADGADKGRLRKVLQWAQRSGLLSGKEIEYIKTRPSWY